MALGCEGWGLEHVLRKVLRRNPRSPRRFGPGSRRSGGLGGEGSPCGCSLWRKAGCGWEWDQRRSGRGLAWSQGEHLTCSVPAAPHTCLLSDGRRDPGVPRRPSVAR